MNVEIRTEAAQFPEKDYINGIFVAVSAELSVIFHFYIASAKNSYAFDQVEPNMQSRPSSMFLIILLSSLKL